jgi:hypothetical protein
MKSKILALSFSIMAFSCAETQAGVAVPVDFDGIANASAYLYWDELSITGIAITPITLFESQSHARTADFWNIYNQPTWVDDDQDNVHATSAVSVIPVSGYDAAKAVGETTATFVFSDSTAQFMPGSYGEYSAEARARKDQSYKVTSTGIVTFSIPYDIDVTFVDANNDNYAFGWAQAWSRLRVWTWANEIADDETGFWSEVIDSTYKFVEIYGEGSLSSDLSFEYNVTDLNLKGTYLRFEAGADTIVYDVNPVPVPPSVLMLLTGCTSLFFLKRRKG